MMWPMDTVRANLGGLIWKLVSLAQVTNTEAIEKSFFVEFLIYYL